MLTDKQYSFIEPHLPRKRRKPTIDDRSFLNAVLYVLLTGCQWRKLPPSHGKWHTVYTRFKRWSEKGLMQKIIGTLLEKKVIDCSIVMIDSTSVRAHHSAAGALKKKDHKHSDDQKADIQRKFMQCLLTKNM